MITLKDIRYAIGDLPNGDDVDVFEMLTSYITELESRVVALETAMARVLQAVPSAASAAALAHEQVVLREAADMLASIGTRTIDMPTEAPRGPVAAAPVATFAVGQRVVDTVTDVKGEIVRIEADGWLVVQTAIRPETIRWNPTKVTPAPVAAPSGTTPKAVKLSKAQREALELLDKRGDRGAFVSYRARWDYINQRVAYKLLDLGYIKNHDQAGNGFVIITDLGRAALQR